VDRLRAEQDAAFPPEASNDTWPRVAAAQ